MKNFLTIPLLILASLFGNAATNGGVVIDTFTDGTIVDTSAPPTQFLSQSGLSGVIGFGQRDLEWGKATLSSPGPESLDLNNLVPGSAVLSTGPSSIGFWAFFYGTNASSFDIDLTDAGATNAFSVLFTHADEGTLFVDVYDTSNNFEQQSIAFASLPSGGQVVLPFSLFSGLVDFQHAKTLAVQIYGVNAGGSYEMQEFNTQYAPVPEPAAVTLWALGLICWLGYTIRRRKLAA